MRQVLIRTRALLGHPGVLALSLLIVAGGSALVALPLFGLPGFELSLALSVGMGLLGGVAGVVAALQALQTPTGRPLSPGQKSTWALGAALLLNGALLLPPFLTATAYALFRSNCHPFALVGFFPLLTLPSAWLASSVGVFAGFALKRLGRALGLYFFLVLVSLVATVAPLFLGPQVFAFNHFLGYFPGPLYDEALSIPRSLLWFRLETCVLAVFFWIAAGLFLQPRLSLQRLFGVALLLLVWVGFERKATELGFRTTDASLQAHLGGFLETEHFQLLYPRGKDAAELRLWAGDLEFRREQLKTFLGTAPSRRIRVWLHRSEQEKAKWVGAGRTQFAKPWRAELHLNEGPFPHPTLKHELAHVMAAPAGSPPFGVSTRWGVWPLMGLIEGVAVAADAPIQGGLTLHQWAAGMRKEGLAPKMQDLLGPEGFYQAAPARAYTLAGSFLLHLRENYGAEKLGHLYRHADFLAAYGRPLAELVAEWEKQLETLPLNEDDAARAFARFRGGSVFRRACAREVALLKDQAERTLASDPSLALSLYRRSQRLQPEEPAFALGEARALERLSHQEEAREVLSRLFEQVRGKPALEAEVALVQADMAAKRGEVHEARRALEVVRTQAPSPDLLRQADIKLAALEQPSLQGPIDDYFQTKRDDLRLFLLAKAQHAQPQDPFLNYLLGRRLLQSESPREALPYLNAALALALPLSVRREALRLQLEAAFRAGDCGAIQHTLGFDSEADPAYRAQAQEWASRCDFEQKIR